MGDPADARKGATGSRLATIQSGTGVSQSGAGPWASRENDDRHVDKDDAGKEPVSLEPGGALAHGGFIGTSKAMTQLREFIRRIAPSDAVVLVTGETGTGKECVVRLIHGLSRRAQGPLVAMNCASIPETMIEGELFGYERGAFTGATRAYSGKLKLADGGTLLLDEVGELSLAAQAKTLRAIETREAYRLGGRIPARFDARLVAATNRDLEREAEFGRFRRDLFYRLAVAQIRIPPLRERIEDIAVIARYLLTQLAAAAGKPDAWLDDGALDCLAGHDWPGNVRELRNAIEVALVVGRGGRIRARDLPAAVAAGRPASRRVTDQRARLLAALARARGNKSLAAQELACSRMTLYRWMARHQIRTDELSVTSSPLL
jgi:DNA-binding NtrC family response regulator